MLGRLGRLGQLGRLPASRHIIPMASKTVRKRRQAGKLALWKCRRTKSTYASEQGGAALQISGLAPKT